jgi:hypothetical protein
MSNQTLSTPLNPIYELVSRPKGKFDESAAFRIGLIVGAVAFGLAILTLVVADITQPFLAFVLPMLLCAFSYLTTIGVPAFSLVFVAVMVNRLVAEQSLSQILITPLSAGKILVGLVDGLYYRLRFIRYIGLSLIPTGCIAVAVAVGYVITGGSFCVQPICQSNYLLNLAIGGFPALIEAAYLMMNFAIQFWCALYFGLWICLRTGQKAFVVSTLLALVFVFAGSLFAFISLSWQSVSSNALYMAAYLGFVILSPVFGYGIGRLARQDSIRLIESRTLFRSTFSD